MRLNKHGWGLKEMLVLSGILILFLIIAFYYIFNLYNSLNQEISIKEYYDLEDKLEGQAKIYLNDYYEVPLTNEKITITRGVLRNYDLDPLLIDSNGNACSGYAVASKSKGIVKVDSYIKCRDYTTDGYEEWRKGE